MVPLNSAGGRRSGTEFSGSDPTIDPEVGIAPLAVARRVVPEKVSLDDALIAGQRRDAGREQDCHLDASALLGREGQRDEGAGLLVERVASRLDPAQITSRNNAD